MNNQGTGSHPELRKKEELPISEKVFRNVCILLVIILAYCLRGFLNFRSHAQQKGYYVFDSDSLVWVGVGFFSIFVAKYSYYSFMRNRIEQIINSRYIGQQRIRKRDMVLKLSYDTCFYVSTTLCSYLLFRNEYWFPTIAGGCGSCEQIYKQYPDWPTDKRTELKIYFTVQLGIHVFSVFEMAIIKRRTQRKFYQYLLHHFVAATLILFSMMCNEIAAGIMILIVHDASDIFIALSRGIAQTKYAKHTTLVGFFIVMLLATWIYFRLVVFPFCLLANVYDNRPMPTDQWYIIHFEYMYLMWMAFVLVGMHLYWTFYIVKSLANSISNKKVLNEHQKIKERKQDIIDQQQTKNNP